MGDAGRPPGLVGRDAALEVAAGGLARSGGVLFVGAQGMGKTTVVRAALLVEEQRPDTHVLNLAGSSGGPSIPFAAFAPHFRHLRTEPGDLTRLFGLLQSAARGALESAGRRRLVLGVDDAHRLDEWSATLVFQLVSTGEALAVMSAEEGRELPEPIHALWKDGHVMRVDLGPLEPAGVVELSEQILGGPVDGELAATLATVSGGTPLYARELLRSGVEAGRIVSEHGTWILTGPLPIGARLAELVDIRLRGVSPDLMGPLEILSFADPLPVELLASVIQPEHSDELQRLGLLRVEETGDGEQVARPGHPVIGELARWRVTAMRAMEIRGRLVDAFEAGGRSYKDLLRVVTWQLDSGRPPDASTLFEASMRAAESFDWKLSARLASASMDSARSARTALAIAEALRHLGRFSEAMAVLEGEEGSSDEERARIAVLRSAVLFWGLGQFDRAEATLAATEDRMISGSERAWVRAVRAGMLTALGRPGECVAAARPILVRPGISHRTANAARAALAMGLAWAGHGGEATALAVASSDRDLARSGSFPLSSRWPPAVRMTAYRLNGQVEEMENLAGEEYRLAVRLHDRHAKAAAAAGLGWVALMRGQLAVSATRLREALSSLDSPDASAGRGQALVTLAEALALAGDAVGAAGVVAEARQDIYAASDWAAPRWRWCAAWASVARGETTLGIGELEAASEEARRTGQVSFDVLVQGALCRLGSASPVQRLEELTPWVEGPLVQVIADHARALAGASNPTSAGESAEALEAVSESYDLLGLKLYAAETAAQASHAFGVAGEPRRAAASSVRAQVLLAGQDSIRPLTVLLSSTPASLTSREREVALLARSGLPSQAIATRLHLSVRTVETHLARVYYKLGITRRTELVAALATGTEEAAGA